jgi:predicted N-formylglutamate amidohydrolase
VSEVTPQVRSLPGVCEARLFRGAAAGAGAPPDLLVEVPHGATRARHFEALRAELSGPFPDDLAAFFHVNTDTGAPEYAVALAERFVAEGARRSALVLTSEIPRTFVDCNRVIDASPEEFRAGRVTPGLPPYVRDERDRALLRARHDAWVQASEAAYAWVCGSGGIALMAHTYAPRTVDVEVDDAVVASLRRAYAPGMEATWPLRPEVDLIARDAGGRIVSEPLVRGVADAFAADGFQVEVSATYPLHPSTLGHRHAVRWEPRAVCVEIRRDLLVERFVPFVELEVSPEKVARVVTPLARAFAAEK